MNRIVFLAALASAAVWTAAQAEPEDVRALPASKYDKLAQHSPFSPPTGPVMTAPTPTPPKPPGWADSLSIAAAMQDGGNYLVTIKDRDSNERFLASTDPAVTNSHDVALTSVQWSDLPNQTQATLRKGTEFAVVTFDATAMQSPGGVSPGAPPIPGNGMARPPIPPLNRPFNAPPISGGVNPANVRRNQIIRSGPLPQPTLAPNPSKALLPRVPGAPLPSADDDDDD